MKMMKKIMFVAFALLVASSFAAKKVKSKLGDVELTKEKDGGSVVCTAGFNDELTVLKEGDTEVLVKGSCGQGWVPKSKIEYVAQKAGDKSMKLEDVDISWKTWTLWVGLITRAPCSCWKTMTLTSTV